jgi:hypothetical protein
MIMRRKEYSKDRVKQLCVQRNLLKSLNADKQDFYAKKVGKLRAAGHFTIGGFTKFTKTNTNIGFAGDNAGIYTTELSFRTLQKDGTGDAPHISGYLQSASDADKVKYRLKGWFNEDGTIRIELVD